MASPRTSGSKGRRSLPDDLDRQGEPTDTHIAVAAYYRAEARGFAPGSELGDWLEAETQLKRGETQ